MPTNINPGKEDLIMISIGDFFWIFIMLSMLQPWVRQRMLESSRWRLMRRLETERGSRVILLVHRQETMSFLGFPVFRYIDINDSEEVIRAIHLTDEITPIDLVLHTPGGLVLASVQIARAIKAHKGKVTVFVPHYAMSGGTLISLAADEIVMNQHAVLGPVDPQLGEYPAASLVMVTKTKDVNKIADRTLILADVGEKSLQQIGAEVRELLEGKMAAERLTVVADELSQGIWTHDHPISRRDAEKLGLPVKADMPEDIYKLMSLFPQPTIRQPTVHYIPGPRDQSGSPKGKHM
jgi:ClpP class serine protease